MSSEKQLVIDLQGGWRLCVDQSDPAKSVSLGREDGKFFTVRFSTLKYGQPVVDETIGADGYAGVVFPIVKCIDGKWHVLAVKNERPANDYAEPLLEGARSSVSNENPHLTATKHAFEFLPGYGYSNSARIKGKIRKAIVDVTEGDFEIPKGAEFVSFRQFFDQSSDFMTQAVLGQFLVHQS